MYPHEIELYALRHAESVANTNAHLISGRSNESEITPKGVEQAKTLGRFMLAEDIQPDFVYVSPAKRTLLTAHHSLTEMGLAVEPIIEDALQELDQGLWVGLEREKVYNEDVLTEIARLGKDFKAEGGESMNEVGKRMLTVSSEIADRHADDGKTIRIFMFTHGLAIRCLASQIHNWSQKRTYETEVPNASINLFTRTLGKWQLQYLGLKPETP